MSKIVATEFYNGTQVRMQRLGMIPLWDELQQILTGFELLVQETRDSNSGAVLREMIDQALASSQGWTKKAVGDVDWTKCLQITPNVQVCIGVEIQISGRSDLLY